MGLDVRWPIGIMFTLIGALLLLTGLLYGADARSLNININLWWGIVLLGFGVTMLVFASRGSKAGAAQTGIEPKK